jgi:ubiquinol-cytochrome c reductase cytochrome c1 subunit
MKTLLNRFIFVVACSWMSASVLAASGHGVELPKIHVNLQDTVALQNGAQIFVNHCQGCHSMQYLRYERMAADLKIPADVVQEQLIFDNAKIGDPILTRMQNKEAKQWFGIAPPDLTLLARRQGADWLYGYLTSFYADPTRPWGVNNHVFPGVGMPHVLEQMQSSLGEKAFQSAMSDLTHFMVYAAEPMQLQRRAIGRYVLIFLLILLIPVYFLNREYWKDIH